MAENNEKQSFDDLLNVNPEAGLKPFLIRPKPNFGPVGSSDRKTTTNFDGNEYPTLKLLKLLEMFDRLQNFLPKMKEENEKLKSMDIEDHFKLQSVSEEDEESSSESNDEDPEAMQNEENENAETSPQNENVQIRMNLGLGVYDVKERKPLIEDEETFQERNKE